MIKKTSNFLKIINTGIFLEKHITVKLLLERH